MAQKEAIRQLVPPAGWEAARVGYEAYQLVFSPQIIPARPALTCLVEVPPGQTAVADWSVWAGYSWSGVLLARGSMPLADGQTAFIVAQQAIVDVLTAMQNYLVSIIDAQLIAGETSC